MCNFRIVETKLTMVIFQVLQRGLGFGYWVAEQQSSVCFKYVRDMMALVL